MKRILFAVSTALSLSGCGLLFGHHDPSISKGVYHATRFDFGIISSTPEATPLVLLDLPFSLVGDTLMLPVDIYELIQFNKRIASEKHEKENQIVSPSLKSE